MKILAKTTGPTLVCTSGDFLDAYRLRLVEYDVQVRGWNNRNLLDIKLFIEDNIPNSELEELGEEEFIKKYSKKKEEKVAEEPVWEPGGGSEVEKPEYVEEVVNKKVKNKGKKKS